MFQRSQLKKLAEYFVLMDADEDVSKSIYDRARMSDILRPDEVPNYWAFHFFSPDGKEMKDLYIEKTYDMNKIKVQMMKAIKKMGSKGMPQSKFDKAWKDYEYAKLCYEIKDYREAEKEFEKLEKLFDEADNPMAEEVKTLLKSIETMFPSLLEKAKKQAEAGELKEAFILLYEMSLFTTGFSIRRDVKSTISDLRKQYSDNDDLKDIIDLAMEHEDALECYQKAHVYLFKGRDKKAGKYFEKLDEKYPETSWSGMPRQKIEVKLPTAEQVETLKKELEKPVEKKAAPGGSG